MGKGAGGGDAEGTEMLALRGKICPDPVEIGITNRESEGYFKRYTALASDFIFSTSKYLLESFSFQDGSEDPPGPLIQKTPIILAKPPGERVGGLVFETTNYSLQFKFVRYHFAYPNRIGRIAKIKEYSQCQNKTSRACLCLRSTSISNSCCCLYILRLSPHKIHLSVEHQSLRSPSC